MMLIRRRLLIGIASGLCTLQAAIAANVQPIIIIQAPEVSGAEFVNQHTDDALPTNRRKPKPHPAAEVATPPAPVAAETSLPVPSPTVAAAPAKPAETTTVTPDNSVEAASMAPALDVSQSELAATPGAKSPAEGVPTAPVDAAPVAAPAAAPIVETAPAENLSFPPRKPSKALVVAQPAEVSGAAFIVTHAPAGMAKPIPNLKLTIRGKDNIPLRKAAIELIDSDGNTALSTLACEDVLLTSVKPGVYHLNVGFDTLLVTQNVTVTANKVAAYTIPLPTMGKPDSGPLQRPAPLPTPLHVMLDTFYLTPHAPEQHCP